ncbi:hypothetical protein FDT66_02930 [Polaribacter aestuariivivens]|uniref:DUF4136 domain-containing protein n=1 Tax=Polaribacter aestuariivivens TaxID=2304626 RepID=A0A5S3NCV0_9FLAO|nr:hypothetical protein [Polaribacter aestuariivivens]TMM32434.1 hypothetical protein FDT66_02930 [Polaribacter aestuariivivens]
MKNIFRTSIVLLLLILLNSCNEICNHEDHAVNNTRPSNAITYKEMAAMFHQYDVGQKKVLDKYRGDFTANKNDTIESVSHYYEINQLKQYIAYLEKISKDKEITLTGIRIFSAAYPKNYKDKSLSGRYTLIFMPTAEIEGNKSVAFEPLYSKTKTPIKFTEFLNKYSSEETKQVMRASFFSFLQDSSGDDLESSGANKLKPTPPM